MFSHIRSNSEIKDIVSGHFSRILCCVSIMPHDWPRMVNAYFMTPGRWYLFNMCRHLWCLPVRIYIWFQMSFLCLHSWVKRKEPPKRNWLSYYFKLVWRINIGWYLLYKKVDTGGTSFGYGHHCHFCSFSAGCLCSEFNLY